MCSSHRAFQMTTEVPHNPFQAPDELSIHPDVETTSILLSGRRFPTPLFRWLTAIILFELVLSPLSLGNKLWPAYLSNPLASAGCFGLNVLVLGVAGWQIGRRLKLPSSVSLSQLIHIIAWLVFILVGCLMTNWEFTRREWEWALRWVASSAILNGLVTAVASAWFRAKPVQLPE